MYRARAASNPADQPLRLASREVLVDGVQVPSYKRHTHRRSLCLSRLPRRSRLPRLSPPSRRFCLINAARLPIGNESRTSSCSCWRGKRRVRQHWGAARRECPETCYTHSPFLHHNVAPVEHRRYIGGETLSLAKFSPTRQRTR